MGKDKIFDRNRMIYYPLSERANKVDIVQTVIKPTDALEVPKPLDEQIEKIAQQILEAKEKGAAVMCSYGAHAIKNGLGLLLGKFLERGWFTHIATNGAGIIHDWEIAYQGKTSEDVRANVQVGKFGTWEETGLIINLALAVGAYRRLGYGESIGVCMSDNGLDIPSRDEIKEIIISGIDHVFSENDSHNRQYLGACFDLLELLDALDLAPGFLPIEHPFRDYSLQYIACREQVRSTSHPMFGHDIIYTHKANRGTVIGRTAERDFLSFVDSVSNLEGGVYLSIGSAVMSPMIFEKALSMARNVSIQEGRTLKDINIHVVDLQESSWDWRRGEPPAESSAYYLRFMKTFARMGCESNYITSDNRAFLLGLYKKLNTLQGAVQQ